MRVLLYTNDPSVCDLEIYGFGVHFLRMRISKESLHLSLFGLLLVSSRFDKLEDGIYMLDIPGVTVEPTP